MKKKNNEKSAPVNFEEIARAAAREAMAETATKPLARDSDLERARSYVSQAVDVLDRVVNLLASIEQNDDFSDVHQVQDVASFAYDAIASTGESSGAVLDHLKSALALLSKPEEVADIFKVSDAAE